MQEDSFTQEAFTLLGISFVFVLLRELSRVAIVGFKGLWIDDYLMMLAIIVYGLETGTAYVVGAWYKGLANNSMTDEYRANLSTASEEYHLRMDGSKAQLLGWSLYTLLLWLLKLCMCIFFTRLTQGIYNMQWRVRIAYVVVFCSYIAAICSILLGCRPFHRNWQIHPDPGNHCQPAISRIDLYVTVVLNVASDAYIMSIPVMLFSKAGIPWPKRLSMIAVFSGGLFVMAAGCLRCALIIQDPVGGAQAAGSWAVRESFVAIIVTNVPIVYQGYRKALHPRIRNSMRSSKNSEDPRPDELRHEGDDGRRQPRKRVDISLSSVGSTRQGSVQNSWLTPQITLLKTTTTTISITTKYYFPTIQVRTPTTNHMKFKMANSRDIPALTPIDEHHPEPQPNVTVDVDVDVEHTYTSEVIPTKFA